jgi:hypothetical protein
MNLECVCCRNARGDWQKNLLLAQIPINIQAPRDTNMTSTLRINFPRKGSLVDEPRDMPKNEESPTKPVPPSIERHRISKTSGYSPK